MLTLPQCLTIGLTANPALELARQNLVSAREKAGEARAGYYPTFKFATVYTHNSATENDMSMLSDGYETHLSVRQTVYDGRATKELVRAAGHNARAQEYEGQKTGLDIVQNIKAAYFETLKRRELLEVTKAMQESAAKHLEQARALYKEGMTPRSDVIKAEVRVSSAQLEAIQAENAWLSAKAVLAAAMGLPVTTAFDTVRQDPDSRNHEFPPLETMLALAHDSRPELQGAKARIAAAEAGRRQAQSGLYPNISLDASYGWQENRVIPDDQKWSVGITIGIPVFEQLTARSKVNQAIATINGLKATETQTRRNIELEVKQAWLGLKEAHERQSVSVKALEQSTEDMLVSEGRYQEGVGTILEVIDAQTALTQAQTNQVAAFDIATAQVKLDRATGQRPTEEIGK